MLEFINITAQYSNAVLVAILPQVSDFVKKAAVPIQTPIAIQEVAKFNCSPLKDDIGGAITLKNGLWVLYLQGHVVDFRTPRSYYNLQQARDIPKFYGTVNLGKDEALNFTRAAIQKLGYSLKETFTDQEPAVDLPVKIGTNIVPYYRFQWQDPVFGKTAVRVEVNAESKRIEEMRLSSPFFWRAPPKVQVQPTVQQTQTPLSASVSNEFLSASLPKIAEFARKLKLPFRSAPTARQVETVKLFNSGLRGWLKLSNGYSFIYENGAVTEFSAPGSIYGFRPSAVEKPSRPFESYLGKWKLNDQQSAELVRQAIRKLGYAVTDFDAEKPPDIKRNQPFGKYTVPRCRLSWITNDPATGRTVSLVTAEVNTDAKRLEYLQLFGGPLLAGMENPSLELPRERHISTNTPPEPPIDAQTLEFLEHNMGALPNTIPTNSTTKPFNPFE